MLHSCAVYFSSSLSSVAARVAAAAATIPHIAVVDTFTDQAYARSSVKLVGASSSLVRAAEAFRGRLPGVYSALGLHVGQRPRRLARFARGPCGRLENLDFAKHAGRLDIVAAKEKRDGALDDEAKGEAMTEVDARAIIPRRASSRRAPRERLHESFTQVERLLDVSEAFGVKVDFEKISVSDSNVGLRVIELKDDMAAAGVDESDRAQRGVERGLPSTARRPGTL